MAIPFCRPVSAKWVQFLAARCRGWWRRSTTRPGNPVPGESEQRLKQPGSLDRSTTRQPATLVKWSGKYDSSTEKGSMQAGMKVWALFLRVCYSGAPHARGPARSPSACRFGTACSLESFLTCRHTCTCSQLYPPLLRESFQGPTAGHRQGGGGVMLSWPVLAARPPAKGAARPILLLPTSRVSCELSRPPRPLGIDLVWQIPGLL